MSQTCVWSRRSNRLMRAMPADPRASGHSKRWLEMPGLPFELQIPLARSLRSLFPADCHRAMRLGNHQPAVSGRQICTKNVTDLSQLGRQQLGAECVVQPEADLSVKV